MPENVCKKRATQAERLDVVRLLALAESAMTAAVQVSGPGGRAVQVGAADRLVNHARKLRRLRHSLEREAGAAEARAAWEQGWQEGRAATGRLTGRGDPETEAAGR